MSEEKQPKLNDYFNGCLYFSLSKLQRDINRLAEQAFEESELAPSHAFLLMALNENEKCSASDLSLILGCAPSTITRFVDKLESKGLCLRLMEGRISYTSITKKGKDFIPEIQTCWKELFNLYNKAYGISKSKELNDLIVSFFQEK